MQETPAVSESKAPISPRKMWKKTKGLLTYFPYWWNRLVWGRRIDNAPAFIVGCPHSGTSILLAILSAHPEIFAVPYESYIATGDREKFLSSMRKFDRLTIAAGKSRWVEKSPRHIRYIGAILQWCPAAKIIIIVRDGRDVAFSIKQRTGSLEQGIRRWRRDNLLGKHFATHAQVLTIKYEDLVADFETTVTAVLTFLGEQYRPDLKDYHREPKKWYARRIARPETPFMENHKQHRNWQINQPLFDGRGRWKSLSTEELATIHQVAGPLLADLGYSQTDAGTDESASKLSDAKPTLAMGSQRGRS